MADGNKENVKKAFKYKLLIILSGIFLFLFFSRFAVFSETPPPEATVTSELPQNTSTIEASPATEMPTEGTASPTPTPTLLPTPTWTPTEPPMTAPPAPQTEAPTETIAPTEAITASPTPTPELHFLYEFTVPPLNQEGGSDITPRPDHTPVPTMSAASIGIVQVEDISNVKRGFRWFDFIKYAEYMFYVLAGLSILYGIICLIGLLCFNKDISIGAIRKRKKEKRKAGKR
ncbi:MAG: hypothetical protein ACLSVG_05405 [Clostridia bacterium]